MGVKLVTAATTEQVPSLGLAIRKLGRALDAIAGIQHVQVRHLHVPLWAFSCKTHAVLLILGGE